MSAKQFEERLLLELKDYVNERSTQAAARPEGRRSRAERRARSASSPWRLASGGISLAAVIALAVVLTDGGAPSGSSAANVPFTTTATAPDPATAGPLYHVEDAGFAVDAEASGVVDITITEGSAQPDVDAVRSALAKAGIVAKVLANVPTCAELKTLQNTPGAPTPVESAQADAVTDMKDQLLTDSAGDEVFQLDRSAATHGTTVWILFSSTLSTMATERLTDSSPKPNCL
jgi:hypothetical protein